MVLGLDYFFHSLLLSSLLAFNVYILVVWQSLHVDFHWVGFEENIIMQNVNESLRPLTT
jgi:hypothetical protein